MKKFQAFILCTAIIGAYTNITAMTDDGMAEAVAHLNQILHRKKISSNDTSTSKKSTNVAVDKFPEPQFLQDLDNDIKDCERGIPRLKKNLAQDKKEFSSSREYRPYLNHLERYYNDVNNFNEKNKILKYQYPMYSAIRKEAIRMQFYQERNKLGTDYQTLHETNWVAC